MMKIHFKYAAVFAAAIGLMAPLNAFAAVAAAPAAESFCTQISGRASELQQKFIAQQGKVSEARQNASGQLQQKRGNQDARLKQVRDKADQDRAAEIAALNAHADTAAEKQAVTAFQSGLTAALAARRTAVDSAIAAFRQGIDHAQASRQADINAAIDGYQTAINAAVAKATSDCNSGVAPRVARQTFVASMRTAVQNFRAARQSAEKIPAQVAQLAPARRQSVQAAFDVFRAAMEQARGALKAAFPQNAAATSSPSSAK